MIGYVTVGTDDLARSASFYGLLLGLLGGSRFMENDQFVAWQGAGGQGAGFGVCKPHDGNSATVGNGTMAALAASDPDQVKALYDMALALGGSDEGAPGLRFGQFYAAYFRDLDGNKLNAFCMLPEEAAAD